MYSNHEDKTYWKHQINKGNKVSGDVKVEGEIRFIIYGEIENLLVGGL